MEYSRDKHSGSLLINDRSEIAKCRRMIRENQDALFRARHAESQDMMISSLFNRITSLEMRVKELENKLQNAQSNDV